MLANAPCVLEVDVLLLEGDRRGVLLVVASGAVLPLLSVAVALGASTLIAIVLL